ncbi:MAG: carbohydrate ABC transporter permease [Pleurocapsa minor GSE-CHR-MK-17-07R]|jgi:ABC-type glycerol-3-phosphate transport system permease component|nr:carbohydrate ABC transporter permease [Pleurocapsa minor GSE-CHR-MK 17-07R]
MADVLPSAPSAFARGDASQKVRQPIPVSKIATYATLIIGGLLALLPFVWMLSWSLMTNSEVIAGRFLPAEPQWQNYLTAWNTAQFSRLMWNSVRITAITVTGLLLFCIPAAYAFARIRFWGRNVIFALFLATLMIPDIVTLIPNLLSVVWISRLSESIFGESGAWLNNWPSLTIPFMASAFTIFLLRQFFAQIPEDLWDAARIDGATHFTFLRFVAVPLARAPIMTTLTFAFIGSWNSLVWPLLVVSNDDWRPIAFGLTKFVQTDAGDEFHLQMAASVIMIIPILIVYFITQKQFTEGIWTGSVKG